MLRLAILVLAVVVGLLLLVSLLPKAPRVIPDSTIKLSNTTLTLYPQEDPEAVWFFNSPNVDYDPDSRETTLFKVQDGKRTVNNETDFTLQSEQVTIGSDDNMYGERIAVYIPDGDYDLDMQSKDGSQVFINQSAGEFEVPRLDMTSGNDTSTYERVRMSFDIESFSAGGEGTVGYSQFEIGESDGQ